MVLVFGTICLDRVRRIPHLPGPGQYVEIESEQTFLGGEAANTANALQAWGREIELAGNPMGCEDDAEDLLRMIREHGLPTQHLQTGGATPLCEIYVTPDGERTMFGRGFAKMGDPVDPTRVPFRRDGWFTADPNMGSVARETVRLAHAAGMRLYIMDFLRETDPVPPASYWQSSTDWAGVRGNTQKNVEWVKKWVDRNGAFCVLSDGPNGFVAGSPDLPPRHYPPFPCPEMVDTTGAGDMFRAGMLYGLDQQWPIADCLRFASAAGCLKCQYLGATSRVPTVAEIEAHIAANPEVSKRYEG